MDPRDRLAPAHYRFINSISVDDPMPLGSGATSAVKVRFCSAPSSAHVRHLQLLDNQTNTNADI